MSLTLSLRRTACNVLRFSSSSTPSKCLLTSCALALSLGWGAEESAEGTAVNQIGNWSASEKGRRGVSSVSDFIKIVLKLSLCAFGGAIAITFVNAGLTLNAAMNEGFNGFKGWELERMQDLEMGGGGGGGDGNGGRGEGGGRGGDHGDGTEGSSWNQDGRFLSVVNSDEKAGTSSDNREQDHVHLPRESRVSQGKLIIVVPALNEEENIKATIEHLQRLDPPASHIVVVDGGSSDSTVQIAEALGTTVIISPRGRAKQMNAGAKKALSLIEMEFEVEKGASEDSSSVMICFCHADTLVPKDLVSLVQASLGNPDVVCGGFVPLVQVPRKLLWGVSLRNVWKTWYIPMIFHPLGFARGLRVLYGDQCMFCRLHDFFQVGGFNEQLMLLEDADLCKKLHLQGGGSKVVMLNRLVSTSGRRFEKVGLAKSSLINVVISLAYAFHASPNVLHKLYKWLYTEIR